MQRNRPLENPPLLRRCSPKMKPTLQTRGRRVGKFLTRSANASRPDLSSLRKPIDTSVSDLYQVSELLEDGTDEVKSILSYECNIIYECRICQSLFRSIVNLVSHKREYCKEKFDTTVRRRVMNNMHSSRDSIAHMYKTEQTNDEGVKNDRILRSQVSKESNKKDLSAIIEMLNKRREEYVEQQRTENDNVKDMPISNVSDDRNIYLEPIDTNGAVMYQTIESSDAVIDSIDLMKEQITKLQNITDQKPLATELEEQPENQLEKSDSPIQAKMSDEENESLIYRLPMNNLSCAICSAKFSTKKTLTVHIKTLHASKRLCYPCPYCTNIFANSWSVYRHLYKVHKKTNEQVRNLKPLIQEKAFHRKASVMRDIKNVRATEVSAANVTEDSNKIQEPKNHIEPAVKVCDRRKRRANRKVSTYLQYCQTPIAACDEKTIRIKQCNTSSASLFDDVQCKTENVDLVANTIIKSSVGEEKDTSSNNSERMSSSSSSDQSTFIIRDISSLSKEAWDKSEKQENTSEHSSTDNNNSDITSLENVSERNSVDNDSNVTSPENIDDSKLLSPAENQDNFVSDESLKSNIICTNANKNSSATLKTRNKKEKASNHPNEKRLTDLKERDKTELEEDTSELQFSCSSSRESNRVLLIENKIATLANFHKLRCLLCKRKFTSIANLRRHMAMHIGWNRYRCKLCDFKCFVKCDCVTHCNKVHNMQNNRKAIAETILEIPQDEYMCNEDVASIVEPKRKSDSTDITSVTASPCQLKMRENSSDSSDSDTRVISQSEPTAANEQVAELHGNPEYEDVDANEKTADMQDLSGLNIKNGRKLEDDPELKRMVMEVIFGPTNTSTIEAQTDSNKPVLETNDDDSNKRVLETNDDASGNADATENVNNATVIEKPKEAFRSILNNMSEKYRRPMRKRIKPLSKDFIYDLKEGKAYRKESALINVSEASKVRKKAKLYN